MSGSNSSGQGSLSYLLLIGGAVLVAAVALVLLSGMAGTQQGVIGAASDTFGQYYGQLAAQAGVFFGQDLDDGPVVLQFNETTGCTNSYQYLLQECKYCKEEGEELPWVVKCRPYTGSKLAPVDNDTLVILLQTDDEGYVEVRRFNIGFGPDIEDQVVLVNVLPDEPGMNLVVTNYNASLIVDKVENCDDSGSCPTRIAPFMPGQTECTYEYTPDPTAGPIELIDYLGSILIPTVGSIPIDESTVGRIVVESDKVVAIFADDDSGTERQCVNGLTEGVYTPPVEVPVEPLDFVWEGDNFAATELDAGTGAGAQTFTCDGTQFDCEGEISTGTDTGSMPLESADVVPFEAEESPWATAPVPLEPVDDTGPVGWDPVGDITDFLFPQPFP